MAKVLKIAYRSVWIIVEWAFILLIMLAFAIRLVFVQTYFGQRAADWLSQELGTSVHIDKVDIAFFDHVYLDGFYIEDLDKDTLGYLNQVAIKIDHISRDFNKIQLREVKLGDGKINLIKKLGQERFNYAFIQDYFDSDKPTEKSKSPEIFIADVFIENTDFKYILEYRRDYENGINFNKLDLRKINLHVQHLTIINEVFDGRIAHLNAEEKSGFVLDHFDCDFVLSSAALSIKKGNIKTAKSNVFIPNLYFNTKTWDNYNYFEDSVFMDIQLSDTRVSMADVAYFAPDLWGMHQDVALKGRAVDYVYNLKIKDVDLRLGHSTVLQGDFELPDVRKDSYGVPIQKIRYFKTNHADLEAFRLPDQNGLDQYITFPKDKHTQRIIRGAGNIVLQNATLGGELNNMAFTAEQIKTDIGTIVLNEGINLFSNSKSLIPPLQFRLLGNGLQYENLDLALISGQKELGKSSGIINLQGQYLANGNLDFTKANAKIDYLDILGHRYTNIKIIDSKFDLDEFEGFVAVNDPNARLTFDGNVQYSKSESALGNVNIEFLNPEKIAWGDFGGITFTGDLEIDIKGFVPEYLEGRILATDLTINRDTLTYNFNNINIQVDRSNSEHRFDFQSDVAYGYLSGDLNFVQIASVLHKELAELFPIFFKQKNEPFIYEDRVIFDFTVLEINAFLDVVYPDLQIGTDSRFFGFFNGADSNYVFNILSNQVDYQQFVFSGISSKSVIQASAIDLELAIDRFNYNDSLYFDSITFNSMGTGANFKSALTWDELHDNEGGSLIWNTDLLSKNEVLLTLLEGHYYFEQDRWELDVEYDAPKIFLNDNKVEINSITFLNGIQYINASGLISEDENDELRLLISDVNLEVVNKLLIGPIQIAGYAGGNLILRNLLKNPIFEGSFSADDFELNGNYLGNMDFNSHYNDKLGKLEVDGSLVRAKELQRGYYFHKITGDYYLSRTIGNIIKPDKLDFSVVFDTLDISFANAFVDDNIATNIAGVVAGELNIDGTSKKPLLSGNLNLIGGRATIDLLGTTYRIDTPIDIKNYGFSINSAAFLDEENNAGILRASIFHDNFESWNYNVFLDLTRDGVKMDSKNPQVPAKLDRFLALNTKFTEGDIYFGRGYVNGFVNIYGTDKVVDISANLKSVRGTQISFPMFGTGEIKDDDFIVFVNKKDSSNLDFDTKIDFTGVKLRLNIDVTEDAELKIIFDQNTGDEIIARGNGKFDIALDELNNVSMAGTYTVVSGLYNFALGIVRKDFIIESGSTVKWLGDPYEATLNVRTYYLVETNLQPIIQFDLEDEARVNQRDQIYCYLTLKDRLSQPVLEFDIEAPKATDAGRTAISSIRANKDVLTEQFFSLLLFREFRPLRGTQNANVSGSNALNELIASQINAVLNQLSGNYDLRVKMTDDEVLNQSTYELGFATKFLDDRLLISGSFGVSQFRNTETQNANPFISDFNIEYKLNQSGTFRINAFNRSNQFNALQFNDLGPFTQGIGIYYQESFSGWHDFQLVQYPMDLFRPASRRRFYGVNSALVPVPRTSSSDSLR